jgi:hypothetical protein
MALRVVGLASLLLFAAACASRGAAPDRCVLRVVATEQWRTHDAGLDVGYRVKGEAGSAAEVWLAAKSRSGSWVSGYPVAVGPGPFEAVVELDLTGVPEELAAVMQVGARRCKADAPKVK